MNNKHPST